MTPLNDQAIDQLFRSARSLHSFNDRPVEDATLRTLYDLLKWGPTAFNAQPARYLFLRSAAAKARLEPALSPGNRAKTLKAPVTVVVAYDPEFFPDGRFRSNFLVNLGLAANVTPPPRPPRYAFNEVATIL